jgi:hypothetical protein
MISMKLFIESIIMISPPFGKGRLGGIWPESAPSRFGGMGEVKGHNIKRYYIVPS